MEGPASGTAAGGVTHGKVVTLTVVRGPDAGVRFHVAGPQVTIGRKRGDLLLSDRETSGIHCSIESAPDGRFIVKDLGSTNGTWVDGRKVTIAELASGQQIRCGANFLLFTVTEEGDEAEGATRSLEIGSAPHDDSHDLRRESLGFGSHEALPAEPPPLALDPFDEVESEAPPGPGTLESVLPKVSLPHEPPAGGAPSWDIGDLLPDEAGSLPDPPWAEVPATGAAPPAPQVAEPPLVAPPASPPGLPPLPSPPQRPAARAPAAAGPAPTPAPAETDSGLPAGVEKSPFGAYLLVERGKDRGHVHPLLRQVTVLGRSETDIVLNDSDVSRRHASLEVQGANKFLLRDLASTNGTLLNGIRVTQEAILNNDKIRMGGTTLKLVVGDARVAVELRKLG